MTSSSVCPSCKCTQIEHVDISGEAVCVNCGTIVEINNIVSSVEFHETSGGNSVVGQFVSSQGFNAYSKVSATNGRSYDSNSREKTLANCRRTITRVAGMLSLGSHYVDSAFRLYALALQRNFTRGRKSEVVIAACLYIVCRRERSPHLLIDFSDALQWNVYVLGGVFLKFCNLLQIHLPLVDPSLYIHRFASQLRLKSKTHTIATIGLRLVASMKRDWIQTGRRPSGICGAALLIAARCQSVPCSFQDVMDVVNIGEHTLRRRLKEFADTPIAQLTYQQIGKLEFTGMECDPPIQQRHRERRIFESIKDGNNSKMRELVSADMMMEKKALGPMEEEQTDTLDGNEAALSASQKAATEILDRMQRKAKNYLSRQRTQNSFYKMLEDELVVEIEETPSQCVQPETNDSNDVIDLESTTCDTKHEECKPDQEQAKDSLSDLDDEEICGLILTPEEVDQKALLWEQMNGEFFKKQEEKRLIKGSTPPPKKKRKRVMEADIPPPDTAQHAIYKLKSRNINYDVINELFGDSKSAVS
uniref:B-related factor 1 n=1 Tax=Albugo laibachii Nc14 TaxID=890382 RepID=F0X0N9_9STRA|nr:transcription factor IIIB putative [Albugo laibachii Nc14]|eukprot:CCA27332.1 transcription factor IIIB putative [Albugo laibachii Nc14]